MESEFPPLKFTPSQQAALQRFARLTRDVGYFALIGSLFALGAIALESMSALQNSNITAILTWLSSYLNGTRTLDWQTLNVRWFKEAFLEIPFSILIGWHLVQSSRSWQAIAGKASDVEFLFGGIEGLSKVWRLVYLREILLVIFIWFLVLFT